MNYRERIFYLISRDLVTKQFDIRCNSEAKNQLDCFLVESIMNKIEGVVAMTIRQGIRDNHRWRVKNW